MPGLIDLNADLGEGVGDDRALLAIVSSANVATGAHAGGGRLLAATLAAAVEAGVALGAHPSYRDRDGFGRASRLPALRAEPAVRHEVVADLAGQVGTVVRGAARLSARIGHVKPHGALYNEAVVDEVAAQVVAESVRRAADAAGHPMAVVTQPGGALADLAASLGLEVIAEGFADRAYHPSGQLVPRSDPWALLGSAEDMARQALALAQGWVRSSDGARIPMPVRSICVHGDTPDAVGAARTVRTALESAGWRVGPAQWSPG